MSILAKHKSNAIQHKLRQITNLKKQDLLYDRFIESLHAFEDTLDERQVNCFLSHTWSNGQHRIAQYLTDRLNKYKRINCWLDENNLKYGDHIYDKIDFQITYQTDVALILLSPEYLLSHNCKTELSRANLLYSKNKILLIPIVISKSIIPLELEGLLFADFTDCFTKKNEIKGAEFAPKFKKLVSSILNYSRPS